MNKQEQEQWRIITWVREQGTETIGHQVTDQDVINLGGDPVAVRSNCGLCRQPMVKGQATKTQDGCKAHRDCNA